MTETHFTLAVGFVALTLSIVLHWLDARRIKRNPVQPYEDWKAARDRYQAARQRHHGQREAAEALRNATHQRLKRQLGRV